MRKIRNSPPSVSRDLPVDELEEDNGEDDYHSDVYELRTCYACDVFLPIDKPSRRVTEEKLPCCEACYEKHH